MNILITLITIDIVIHILGYLQDATKRKNIVNTKRLEELQNTTRRNSTGAENAIIERLSHIKHIKNDNIIRKIKRFIEKLKIKLSNGRS